MNTARTEAAAVELGNGKVLIAGGFGPSSDCCSLASTELYDEATNSFEPLANTPVMNVARSGVFAVMLTTGKVMIFGGGGTSTELYDPATNSFAPASATPTTMINAPETATLPNLGKVLVTVQSPVVELYDPTTNAFTLGPNMNLQSLGGVPTATLLK